MGENPERAIPVALGVALGGLFSARLSGCDSGSDKSWDELSNWKYCFDGLSTMRNSGGKKRKDIPWW